MGQFLVQFISLGGSILSAIQQPEYKSKKYGYSDVSVIVDNIGQMRQITEAEALYRLGSTSNNSRVIQNNNNSNPVVSNNQKIIQNMGVTKNTSSANNSTNRGTRSQNHNPSNTPANYNSSYKNHKPQAPRKSSGTIWYWVIGIVILLLIFRK